MSVPFCKNLPKIELHAHLNGSLSLTTLKQLGCLDDSITKYLNKTERTLQQCFELFKLAHNATTTKDSLYFATKNVIQDFADDNVIYLELRTTPRKEQNMTKGEYIETVIKAIEDNENDIMVKLLLSLDRRNDLEDLKETLDIIIEKKNKYPDIIKGIDLSGNPEIGTFYKELFEKAKDNGLFRAIHCAEIKNNKEVTTILSHNPDRLGHATFLHPKYGGVEENWDMYQKLQIPVEFCLTSNVVCGTSKSYESHHIQEWIKQGLPFCISTDDKGIFNSTLSDEFTHVYKNFDLTEHQLWTLSVNAVEYSFASPEEKVRLKSRLEAWKEANNLV